MYLFQNTVCLFHTSSSQQDSRLFELISHGHSVLGCGKTHPWARHSGLVPLANRSATVTLHLAVVRPTLERATQALSHQPTDLIKRTERIQRRATKFILNLPYMCSETYKERLVLSNLSPFPIWMNTSTSHSSSSL